MCASATTMDKRKQDDHVMIMVMIMMMISQCSVLSYAHVVAVVCPCCSSSMPVVVYICKTPFSLYTLSTSTTCLFVCLLRLFVCCIGHVGMIWSEYCDSAAWDE